MQIVLSVALVIIGVSTFSAGYFFGITKQYDRASKEQEILVKRTKPSFRNPAKTTETTFDKYKSTNGLYAPVRPGKGSVNDEVKIGG